MDLQADSVQGVLFLVPGQHQDDAIKLWEDLFPGDSPDGFQRANASPSLISTAWGERTTYHFVVAVQVGRIDISLTAPPPTTVDAAAGPLRITDVPLAATRIAELLKVIAGQLKVVRLALVLELAKTVSRGKENTELLDLLPGFPFPKNATDVLMQFNSRRAFVSAPDVEMNRLCVWSAGQIAFIPNPAMQGTGMMIMQGPGRMIMSPFVGVKVDVNTAQETRPPIDSVVPIIDEMLAESLGIYAAGVGTFER